MKSKIGILMFALMFAFNLISAVDYSNCPMSGTYGMMYGGYGSGMMFLGWITYILVIVLIIAAIYWLFKSANKKK
jgi:uncharacterized membrane protein